MITRFTDRIEPNHLQILERHLAETPVRVGKLASDLGISVYKAVLPPKISGLIRPSDNSASGFEIQVNKYDSPERQRFTIAHEIGHFLLHTKFIGAGIVDNILYRSSLGSSLETEANKIAADIVMPKSSILSAVKEFNGQLDDDDIYELAQRFKVSIAALKIRMQEI